MVFSLPRIDLGKADDAPFSSGQLTNARGGGIIRYGLIEDPPHDRPRQRPLQWMPRLLSPRHDPTDAIMDSRTA